MGTAWENLVSLNKQNKKFSGNSFKLVKENKRWGFYTDANVFKVVETYDDILNYLRRPLYYWFDNISVLRNSKVVKRFALRSEWTLIYDHIIESCRIKGVKTFKIIRVDNMTYYLNRLILTTKTKYKLCLDMEAYKLIVSNDTIILLSDIVFYLDDYNYIRLADLRIENIYINNLDISKLTYLEYFFSNLTQTKQIVLENFDTRRINNYNFMFKFCKNLKYINIENIKTNNAITMKGMFRGCLSLMNLDLRHFIIKDTCDIEGIFYGCTYRKTFFVTNKRLKGALYDEE